MCIMPARIHFNVMDMWDCVLFSYFRARSWYAGGYIERCWLPMALIENGYTDTVLYTHNIFMYMRLCKVYGGGGKWDRNMTIIQVKYAYIGIFTVCYGRDYISTGEDISSNSYLFDDTILWIGMLPRLKLIRSQLNCNENQRSPKYPIMFIM